MSKKIKIDILRTVILIIVFITFLDSRKVVAFDFNMFVYTIMCFTVVQFYLFVYLFRPLRLLIHLTWFLGFIAFNYFTLPSISTLVSIHQTTENIIILEKEIVVNHGKKNYYKLRLLKNEREIHLISNEEYDINTKHCVNIDEGLFKIVHISPISSCLIIK